MEWVANEILEVLLYLLPGFVSAWIFYGLTSHPKPTQFERIVQALIFTIFTQVCVIISRSILISFGKRTRVLFYWNENISLVLSVLIAIVIGLVFARFSNNDRIHKLLRHMNFTKETSFPSEWYGTFSQKQTYIVLHLTDGRRLYGWPEEWPSVPGVGHFSMAEAEWLDESNKRIKIENVSNILIPAIEIRYIEFMEIIEEENKNES